MRTYRVLARLLDYPTPELVAHLSELRRVLEREQALPPAEPGVITDLRGSWAERWIMAVARAGVMEAFANHTFQPRAIVRRVDLAPIAGRLILGLSTPQQAKSWQSAQTPFTDLFPGHLAYTAASTSTSSTWTIRAPDKS